MSVSRLEVLLDLVELYQLIHNSVDRETTRAVDLELLGDVPSVRDHRMRR